MNKIKYINCFGTSMTAGGGFELDSSYVNVRLSELYKDVDSPLTQFNFSYPGQLSKLIGNDIKINSYAKNGYGNDRMYRCLYDIVSHPTFNKDEHIFLIEYSGLGRKEYWLNDIQDYIVCNYFYDWDTDTLKNEVHLANSYSYDSNELTKILEKHVSMFLEFTKHTFTIQDEKIKILRDVEFFNSYLKQNDLNYQYVTSAYQLHKLDDPLTFTFGDGYYFKQSSDFNVFSNLNKLSITDETNGIIGDNHNGYISNKITAMSIYNKLVDLKLLTTKKIDINWKELKEFKLQYKLI